MQNQYESIKWKWKLAKFQTLLACPHMNKKQRSMSFKPSAKKLSNLKCIWTREQIKQ